MQIEDPTADRVAGELEILSGAVPLRGARVLELGCGRALMTRRIAEEFGPAEIVATEVDRIQHDKNLLIDDLPQVRFVYGGAEAIDLPDGSVDSVLMFKSLHHVPREKMDRALAEIARVLKPGGLAYLSEPVFAGAFNDILRLFNDEREVRTLAFNAVQRAVAEGRLELVEQIFFLSPTRYRDFAEFDERILKVTHTDHRLDDQLFATVRDRFQAQMGNDGANFLNPMRVDLLRRPLSP